MIKRITKNIIYTEDALLGIKNLPNCSVNCCVTSPPYYGLRDYAIDGQIGLEETPEEYVQKLVDVFNDVKRILKNDGTLWLNLGDSYSGSGKGQTKGGKIKEMKLKQSFLYMKGLKAKDLIGIPWMVAFALRANGWYLRQDIIWHKPNPMPESVTDRCTKSHEYIFLLSKSSKYYYDADAIAEESLTFENRPSGIARNRLFNYNSKENLHPEAYRKNIKGSMTENGVTRTTAGLKFFTNKDIKENKNKRDVWSINLKPYKDSHFATYPEKLVEPCIKAGCPKNGIVLDPFMGAGTTALVARKLNRNYIGFEINQKYVDIANKRLKNKLGFFI